MESLVVERVSDFSMGLNPRRAAYINTADFSVARRCCIRREDVDWFALFAPIVLASAVLDEFGTPCCPIQ